jgi:AcrR family transcriptional regulator
VTQRSTYHHGNLRQALIACGMQILQSEGAHGLTLRSVTRAAGVSPGAPRHEFGDLNGLLSAIAVEGLAELSRLRRAASRQAAGPAERLKAVMRVYVDFAVERPGLFWVMIGPAITDRHLRTEVAQAAQSSYVILETHVDEYLAFLGLERARSAELVQCVWSSVHGVSMLFSGRPHGPSVATPMPFEQWRESLIAFALAGLEASARQTLGRAAVPVGPD